MIDLFVSWHSNPRDTAVLQSLYKEQLSRAHVSDLPSSPCLFQRTGLLTSFSVFDTVSALRGEMCNLPCLHWKSSLAVTHCFSSLPIYCCPQLQVPSIKQCYLIESRKSAFPLELYPLEIWMAPLQISRKLLKAWLFSQVLGQRGEIRPLFNFDGNHCLHVCVWGIPDLFLIFVPFLFNCKASRVTRSPLNFINKTCRPSVFSVGAGENSRSVMLHL